MLFSLNKITSYALWKMQSQSEQWEFMLNPTSAPKWNTSEAWRPNSPSPDAHKQIITQKNPVPLGLIGWVSCIRGTLQNLPFTGEAWHWNNSIYLCKWMQKCFWRNETQATAGRREPRLSASVCWWDSWFLVCSQAPSGGSQSCKRSNWLLICVFYSVDVPVSISS